MPKEPGDRRRIVDKAQIATEKECRRRGIRCWIDGAYTTQAQEIFNRAYDHFDGQAGSGVSGKVWIIVTGNGDIGEGPWDDKEDAQDFLNNEVGVVAGLLQVDQRSVNDIRRVNRLAFNIQDEPQKYRSHL